MANISCRVKNKWSAKRIALEKLKWQLTGWFPNQWQLIKKSVKELLPVHPPFPPMPATVPGAVQIDLRREGCIPDWNMGLRVMDCEWVEHIHWEYNCPLPILHSWKDAHIDLECDGFDYSGSVYVSNSLAGTFEGMMIPHRFSLTSLAVAGKKLPLSIFFNHAPEGVYGYTSQTRHFKARFNYRWDWCPRLVPLGIWDRLRLVVWRNARLYGCLVTTDYDPKTNIGTLVVQLRIKAYKKITAKVEIIVSQDKKVSATLCKQVHLRQGETLLKFKSLVPEVSAWFPNGEGGQPLYRLNVRLLNRAGQLLDEQSQSVGFKRLRWLPCEGAPDGAEPWICEINGRQIFLQGVNWTPLQVTYGAVTASDYEKQVFAYKKMGCNMFRVWGGGILEKQEFYEACDKYGLLVWQEFPLSSSGIDNWPPEGVREIRKLEEIAKSYIWRRGSHVAHFIWCGGNELQGASDGSHVGIGKPVTLEQKTIAAIARVCKKWDNSKKFLPTSASGPRELVDEKDYGKGLHHDVHGPWNITGSWKKWERYWANDDALFRSEVGVPSLSSPKILHKYAGGERLWPPKRDTRFWHFRGDWWIQWDQLSAVYSFSEERDELNRYAKVSRNRQARALAIAARACKSRFPRCGGFIVWMGHDCFPCAANTSIFEFGGVPKPAVSALAKVFQSKI